MSQLTEYNPTEAALGELRHRYADVVFDLTTTKGDKEARAARKELVTLRTSLEAKRKELKAPALERAKLIDTEAKRIEAAILELEGPIDAQIKADEARRERERQEKAEREAQRVAGLQAGVDAIRGIPVQCVGADSETLRNTIKGLEGASYGDEFEEFLPLAQRAQADALESLRTMLAKAEAAEAEAQRLAEERAELERQRIAAEEVRQAAEAAAAEVRRQQEAEAAAARAKIEAEQREARERIERQEREAREAREKADAEARAQRAAEEDRLRKEREALEAARREQEAREAAARRAEEERQRAERAAAEAKQREADEAARREREVQEARELAERRARERLLHGRQLLEQFVAEYADDSEFAAIVPAISEFLQPMQAAA